MNENINSNWEEIIKLQKQSIGVNNFIIHGVCFELNEDFITYLQQKNFPLIQVNLSDSLIKEWQDYLMRYSLISGLKFTSYYPLDNEKKAIIETNIYPEGKILTYVTQNLLNNSHLILAIILTHYWLINQLILYPIPEKIAKITPKKKLFNLLILIIILILIITILGII